MIRRRVRVHGRVQGVFFRDSCRQEARAVGVSGWVRNEPDGTVLAVFEGEREPVEQLCRWCEHGNAQAQVTRVEIEAEEPEGITSGFTVAF
jgi:acylphosphatase